MQRRIEFTATGSSALVGNFSSGDVWRGPQEHCEHLVEVHGCAKWADVKEQTVPENQPGDAAVKSNAKKKGGVK